MLYEHHQWARDYLGLRDLDPTAEAALVSMLTLHAWLPEGHLVHFISDSVDSLDLSAFHARYAKGGPRNQPFHPAMIVKVLIYGWATGTFNSRKFAAKLHEDVALRVLAADNYPAHRTLSDFRAMHLEELAALFVQVVRLSRECGLIKLGAVAVDGTKLKAMSYDRMVKAEFKLVCMALNLRGLEGPNRLLKYSLLK